MSILMISYSMYYHFCLLCAFRPFIGCHFVTSKVQPDELCAQAVQSILALAQSYGNLFTFRHVSALIPYFVCTSGLFSLAIEDSRAAVHFIHLPAAASISPEFQGTNVSPARSAPAQSEVSAVVLARLLLSKMGANYSAAAMASEKLSESLEPSWRTEGVKTN